MQLAISKLEDITIGAGVANSRIIMKSEFEDARTLTIFAPAAIVGGGTPVIQITYDEPPVAGGNWVALQKGGTDVGTPAAGKAKSIGDDNGCVPACTGMRIFGSANFTNATTYKCWKQSEY